jgi:hypothetical protein
MIGSTVNKAGQLSIASLDFGIQSRIDSSILKINVDYTMGMCSELSFDVIDIGGEFLNRGYFDMGRDVLYTTNTLVPFSNDAFSEARGVSAPNRIIQVFEIANVTIAQGPGYNPVVQVKCYTKAVQQMKRDRSPEKVKGDGAEFVKRAAAKYGLKFFVEKTPEKKEIAKASGDKQAESLWNVLEGLANKAEYVLFEADGILFFCSQKFLITKWGAAEILAVNTRRKKNQPKFTTERFIPIFFGNEIDTSDNPFINAKTDFQVLQRPSVTRSQNTPLDATGSIVVGRANGTQLRPGMTIELNGFRDYDGYYLIDSVNFEDISPNPVSITFIKPERKVKDIKEIRVGQRFKATSLSGLQEQPMPIQISKNTKQNKNYTVSDEVRRTLQISPGELPANLSVDQRINPLPSRQFRFRYPRIKGALAYGSVNPTQLNMYNRPVAILNSRPRSLYAISVYVESEPGFNEGDPYIAIIPRVTLDGSNQPQVLDDATASAQFVLSASIGGNPEFIAKLPELYYDGAELKSLVPDYISLCNLQEIQVLTKRFGKNTSFKESSIFPIPTSASTTLYPYIGEGLIAAGNIDLYNRPVLQEKSLVKTTFSSTFYPYKEAGVNGGEPFALLLTPIWSSGGEAIELSEQKTLAKYKEDGYFLAKCTSIEIAEYYGMLISEQQSLILETRFPNENFYD